MEPHDAITTAICAAAERVDNAASRNTLAELEAAGYLVPAPAAEPRARPARPQVVRPQDATTLRATGWFWTTLRPQRPSPGRTQARQMRRCPGSTTDHSAALYAENV